MAELRWKGGAGATAKIVTLTPGVGSAAGGTYTTTMTNEAGGTAAIATVSTATTVAGIIDDIIADITATSANALFADVTWTDQSTNIKGTAKVAGIPYYVSTAATSTATAATTYVTATTTANTGPADWNTVANWVKSDGTSATAIPVTADDVKFNIGSQSMLYGLSQSSVSLETFRVGESYTGSIGQTVNGYYLIINVNNTASTSVVSLNGRGESVWLNTTCPNVFVQGTRVGNNAVRLDGDIDNLRVLGPKVQGVIQVNDSAVLDNVFMLGANVAVTKLGASITSIDAIEQDAGRLICNSTASTATVNVYGGTFEHQATSTGVVVATINNRGGWIKFNCGGTLSTLVNYAGTFDLRESGAAAVTITNTTLHGGTLTSRGSLANVTFTNTIKNYGGVADVESGTVNAYI